MFIPVYIDIHGLHDLTAASTSLAYITQFLSAECAITAFIERYPDKMHVIC
ncbi:hypothetical protein OW492_00995 [Psychromonas sp. 14N.309.X.WAT.B.A12]|uniref:hypothetical protein n=1 Tax=Psychromonas sp. 14N.309.X.WAT.B.A12 TaxID=2998322 RepID=UPI0025B18370|nr:hypothetical protein [Psychromonas sp. 14N.309.X.WAT.B.A12]MDN2661948.1 hypothetical protein [Psychromonas sp. 14N.309.X.WAT.B.A12]